MKVKIINKNDVDYNKEFKVRKMKYDSLIINYPNERGVKEVKSSDVEYIKENKIDEFLIENIEFLKIKLKRGISVTFYSILKTAIEDEIGEEIKKLNVLNDTYKVNKRGIWDKFLILLCNDIYPLEVECSGQNFKKNDYNVKLTSINKDNFIEICNTNIDKIEKQLENKKLELQRFQEVLNRFNVSK